MHPTKDLHDEDISCFAIWEWGRAKESEIISDLASHFEILGTFHIHWTDKNYNRNIARLYESDGGTEAFYKYSKKIGKPPFTFLIVRDKKPVYTYMKSVSGAIEPVNRNVIARKHAYRDLFEKHYQVHSSGNYNEFAYQSALVLGLEMLEATLRGENKGRIIELQKDLEGAEGWRDRDALFSILNYSTNYLVLDEEGMDFLCNDYQRLASVANIYQEPAKPYKGTVRVGGQNVAASIRFVGDGYYPAPWEKDILARRTQHKNFYAPCAEDLFFSLLYRAKVHQRRITEKQAGILASIAKEQHYDWYDAEKIHSDTEMAEILAGYMRAKKYFYESPLDKSAGENPSVVKCLPHLKSIGSGAGKKKLRRLKNAVRKIFRKRQDA